MTRHFDGGKLVIASHNPDKVREIAELLGPHGADVVSAGDLGLPEPEETGKTFAENAIIKALSAVRESGFVSLADDSGLVVHGIDGQPGIYSARWSVDGDFGPAMEKVHALLEGKADRTAHFACALALCWPANQDRGNEHCEVFEGRVEGTIVWPPRGDLGFGYDPIFQPDGRTITFGETPHDIKHDLSHRARAFEKLVAACFS